MSAKASSARLFAPEVTSFCRRSVSIKKLQRYPQRFQAAEAVLLQFIDFDLSPVLVCEKNQLLCQQIPSAHHDKLQPEGDRDQSDRSPQPGSRHAFCQYTTKDRSGEAADQQTQQDGTID